MTRRILWILSFGALAGVFLIPFNPVNSMLLRVAWIGALGCGWLGFLILFWKRRSVRVGLAVAPILLAIPFLLPGRSIDRGALQTDYVRRMSEMSGTKYFWGGENSRGIDCSGLPRRALRDAMFTYGIRHLDGSALRSWFEQWWHDASAKALGEGYRSYTKPLHSTGTIAEMDYSGLRPGDLAVTADGVHVLAYMGEGRWIQADPGIGSVVILDGRTSDNSWFAVPVTTHRWRILDPS